MTSCNQTSSACSATQYKLLFAAGLTIYAFWASSKGYDFNFLGPILFSGLMGLFFWGFFQIFFPMVSGRGSVET